MPTPPGFLPTITTDTMVGIVFVLTRSAEPETISLYGLICPMQGEPSSPEHLRFIGHFAPEAVLSWAYENALAPSRMFEAPGLWDFMAEHTGLHPMSMLSLRPVIGSDIEALEAMANMGAQRLEAILPPLPRVA